MRRYGSTICLLSHFVERSLFFVILPNIPKVAYIDCQCYTGDID